MKLLKYENYQVVPTEECFMIKPLRELFNEDTSTDKELFMQQISYLYFMVDPRSPYMDILDTEDREEKVKIDCGLNEDFTPSEKLVKAMAFYKEITTTTSMKLLNSMRTSIIKICDYLDNIDLYAEDKLGKPKYNIDKIITATDKAPQLAKRLQETEKLVAQEITETSRVRGGEDSDHAFEDGFNFNK